jgi:hypothetical protein
VIISVSSVKTRQQRLFAFELRGRASITRPRDELILRPMLPEQSLLLFPIRAKRVWNSSVNRYKFRVNFLIGSGNDLWLSNFVFLQGRLIYGDLTHAQTERLQRKRCVQIAPSSEYTCRQDGRKLAPSCGPTGLSD